MAPPEAPKEVVEYIPDIIVENRKDAEGRLVTYQYARGKLLGKVRPPQQSIVSPCVFDAFPFPLLPSP
jgi:hypothetical protein